MKILITGGSGFIGRHLAIHLAKQGHKLHLLLRNPEAEKELNHGHIKFFRGDIQDATSIESAMRGCSHVYHLAALAKMWVRDKNLYHAINVHGTVNVLEAAEKQGIEKIVFTSTAGVFPPSQKYEVNELSKKCPSLYTSYEKTKNESEEIAKNFAQRGMNIVIVNPTNVFGPGLINDGNTITRIIRDYLKGKWRIIPGSGHQTMNYVFVDDVIEGMIRVMNVAASGSQYILGGDNASYRDLFRIIREITGIEHRLFMVPVPVIKTIAYTERMKSLFLPYPPIITPEWVRKIPLNWSKDISKAKRELDFHPRSFRQAVENTISWLKETNGI